jgi:hypothetical protein
VAVDQLPFVTFAAEHLGHPVAATSDTRGRASAVHLARLLKAENYPGIEGG